MADAIDLYDYEIALVGKISHSISERYSNRVATQSTIQDLQEEIVKRFEEAGFEVQVDITPVLIGLPIDIAVVGRLDKTKELDHDLKRWEILKDKREKGEL